MKKVESIFENFKLGRCILVGNRRLTPIEFRKMSGLSYDWKEAIRSSGFTIRSLIRLEVLIPHRFDCTCEFCSLRNCNNFVSYFDLLIFHLGSL